jgi:uncharacterized protein
MEYIIICIVAFIGSGLTFFSGFGLGTLLTPVFGLFFPIDVAIALTAIVHFLNNLFKLVLTGKHINKPVALQFGIPSILAALAGAYLLTRLSGLQAVYEYNIGERIAVVTPVKLIIAALLMIFAVLEAVPALQKIQFDKKYLPVGGLLSGFFGGLSGNQGALRSAFLLRAGLSKESFIATGVAIACMIDVSRLTIYAGRIKETHSSFNYTLLIMATLAAFAGAYLGSKFLKKVTIAALQYIVAAMLFAFAILLGSGII